MATMRDATTAYVLALLVATPASAATVAGSRLAIKVTPTSANKLVFKAKDKVVDSGNFGSTGDPRCEADGGGGGALRIRDTLGNDVTIPLPCAGWITTNGGPGNVYNTDYRYRDATQATCKRVVVKHGHFIRALCTGAPVAWALGTPESDVDVTLRLGSLPVRNCATFGPPPTEVTRDGSDGRSYRAKDAPRPASCAASPSGAFVEADR